MFTRLSIRRTSKKKLEDLLVGFVVGLVGMFLLLMIPIEVFGQKRTLSVFWQPVHHYDAYDAVYERFEKEHPNIEVKVQFLRIPEMQAKLLPLFEVGNPPDLVETHPSWTLEFGVSGYVEPLNERIEEWGQIDDWLDKAMTHAVHEGNIYGLPMHLTNMGIYYNQDLFKEVGIAEPPEDWYEFLIDAAKLTLDRNGDGRPEIWGFPVTTNTMWCYGWFLQAGAKLYDPETKKVVLDSPEGIEALQFLVDLIHKYKVSPKPVPEGGWSAAAETVQRMFIQGQGAMYIGGPWDIKPVQEAKPQFDWTIAKSAKGRVRAAPQFGIDLTIPKDAKYKDEAWELSKQLVTLETEIAATKEANMPMPRKSWMKHPLIKEMELLQPFIEQLPYSTYFMEEIAVLGLPEIYTTMFQSAFEKALYGHVSPEKALHDFAREASELIRKKIR